MIQKSPWYRDEQVHALHQTVHFRSPIGPAHNNSHSLCVMGHDLLRNAKDLQSELTSRGEDDYSRSYE